MNELILMILFVGFPLLNFLLLINIIRKHQGKEDWFKTNSGFIPEAYDHKKSLAAKHKPRKREIYKKIGEILRDKRREWRILFRVQDKPGHLRSFDPWVLNIVKEELTLLNGLRKDLECKGYETAIDVNEQTTMLVITNPKD